MLNHVRTAAIYAGMIASAAVVFLIVRQAGEQLSAPSAATAQVSAPVSGAPNALFHVLLTLAAIAVTGWLFGRVARWFGQPPVIGEVVAGIALGPSLLGRIAPEATAFLLPDQVAPYLGVIAQLGVILYMFLVGVELSGGTLRARASTAVLTSHASIVAPFLLGALLSLVLYPRYSTADVPFTSFALFMGIAMSITAFPVLARILTDRGMSRTPLGVIALTCAAADDVTAWCLLAIVVGIVQGSAGGALVITMLALGFIGLMFVVVRPLVQRLARELETGEIPREVMAVLLVGILLAALATEAIGIHAIFGAFVLGALIPHDSRLAVDVRSRLEDLSTVILLPAFFAFTGFRTEIGLISSAADLTMTVIIIVVATAGKFGGSSLAARLTGLGWRDAASLGVLMNTRGLMELIVLNIGLDLGVLSPRLFAMMVLMALVTTVATTPIVRLLRAEGLTDPRAGFESRRPAAAS